VSAKLHDLLILFSKNLLQTGPPDMGYTNQKEHLIESSTDRQSLTINQIPAIQDLFIIESTLGKGTFGQVYLASLKACPGQSFALKYIFSKSSPQRVENEIKCLSLLKDCDNIIHLESFVHYHSHIVLVMPFIEHDQFKLYAQTMVLNEVQGYMKALFSCIASVHSLGIIHRDIKPSNCLYNCKKRHLTLIDFGLAYIKSDDTQLSDNGCLKRHACKCDHDTAEVCRTCLHRLPQLSPRSGTPGFKAPEILLKYFNQTSAVDVWSAGIIYLCLLSGKYPFFKVSNDNIALAQLITLFGSEQCISTAKVLHKDLTCSKFCPPHNLSVVCETLRTQSHVLTEEERNSNESSHRSTVKFASTVAYDLLEKCLDLNPFTRITAAEALQHSFLNS